MSDSSTKKPEQTMDNKTFFPVLTQPYQRYRIQDGANAKPLTPTREKLTSHATPDTQPTPQRSEELQQKGKPYREPETMDTAPPDVGDNPITNQDPEPTHMGRPHKHPKPKRRCVSPGNEDDTNQHELESVSSIDSDDQRELPQHVSPTLLRDKITLADHKAIDTMCEALRGKGDPPITIATFSHFLKTCRRQKDPKIIAKEHTANITGLITMLEDNLWQTKDYNLRRRMKRIIDSLKQ
jgi:hypothetical protein